ncbi:MAG: DUF1294 domain-containing protein [Candidatus Magasanikbacteria bacterium]|nr:DUF1294 domain-containing protein [Candidatus Magasanikbacteria bacterium]
MIFDFFNSHPILSIYLVAINIAALFVYGADKIFAGAHAWRIRERTLLLLALFGGSAGALFGMNIFRHKTRKISFQILFVVILLIQLAAVVKLLQYQRGPIIDEGFTGRPFNVDSWPN